MLLVIFCRYNFELTFRKGVRSKVASVKVRVQECSPPKVTIKPQKSAKLNTEDEIVIEGQVHAVALGVNLEYSFVSGDGTYRASFCVLECFSVHETLLQPRCVTVFTV